MKRVRKSVVLHSQVKQIDFTLLFAVGALIVFGLLMIYESSSVSASKDFGDKLYYFKEQLKTMVIGIIAMLVAIKIHYRTWYKYSVWVLLGTLVLLIAVFIPGIGIKAYGANRWINIGFTALQPAEITKISLILYLSAWFSSKETGRFLAFMTLLTMVVGLVVLEPDLGTAFIIGMIAVIMYFLSGASLKHFLMLLPTAITAVIIAAITVPYRFKRVLTFFNPQKDTLGSSYHFNQILIALGSGGIFGLGLGKSRQKYSYLPEATTDSIFAIIAEEIGFIGSIIVIGVYVFIIYRILRISLAAPDKFAQLLSLGIGVWLGVQSLVNLSSITGIIPLTGVPLPFISYGGSGLVVSLFAVGIILNISKYCLHKK